LIQGIGGGSMTVYRWENGLTVMICSDIQQGSSSTTGSINGPPWVRKEEGSVSAQDGRMLKWRIEDDGKKITCTVNDKGFDLDKGNLFLVKTKGGETEIEQTSQDLSAVKLDTLGLRDFARKNPAISKLIELGDE
jgi:hypothetical protein